MISAILFLHSGTREHLINNIFKTTWCPTIFSLWLLKLSCLIIDRLVSLVWLSVDYYYCYLFTHYSFSNQHKLMVFHWRLSDSRSPQVSSTLLSILAVFNNAIVWMVSTQPPTSKSSRLFHNPLVIVPKAPITIGIIITFIFQSFFQSPIGVYVCHFLGQVLGCAYTIC